MRYLSSHKMELEDLFGLPYLRQMKIFQGFLHYLKSRNHVYEQKSGKIENNTCNLYLRNIFGFYQYLEILGGDLALFLLWKTEKYHIQIRLETGEQGLYVALKDI